MKTARKHKEDCGVYELILNDELMKIIFTVNNNVIMVLKFFLFKNIRNGFRVENEFAKVLMI